MFSLLLISLALLSAAQAGQTQAPDTTSVQPQYFDQYVGVVHGKTVPLERAQPKFAAQHNSIFVVRSRTYQSIAGPRSPVRLPADTHFLVRMQTAGLDPLTMIHLQPLKSAKEDREVASTSFQAIPIPFVHNGKTQQAADTTLSLVVHDLGGGTLEIIPSAPLPPGEYAFMGATGAQCFGVDAGSGGAEPAAGAAAAPSAPPKPDTLRPQR